VLSFTKIVAEVRLPVPTYPPNSHYQIIQPYRSSAFIDQSSQNFPHL